MVKFGARFEESRLKRRWSAYAVDYERLKLLLKVAQTAHYAKPAHVKLANFGRDASSRGLLDFVAAKRPMDAFLAAGLDGAERAALEAARQSSVVAALEGDDDEAAPRRGAGHWTRALFGVKDASCAFLLHGFDVALAGEVAEAESLYRREVEGLERRWRALKPSCVAKASGPLRLSLAALDSEARELVDFRAWNLVACGKICKKRDKIFKDEAPIRDRVRAALDGRACWVPGSLDALLRDLAAAFGRVAGCAADVAEAELKLLSTYRGEEAPPPVDDPAQFLRPVSSLMDLSNGLLKRNTSSPALLAAAAEAECRVVFLDVDGVLHAVDVQDEDVFEAKCVDQLVAIVEATGCRLVLSSAWRQWPAMVLRVEALLASRGLEPLLGQTPSLVAGTREHEIRAWLDRNFGRASAYPQWIALDDGRLDGLRGHLVRTDGLVGLTPMDARRAVGLLKGSTGGRCGPGGRCVFCARGPAPIPERLAALRASSDPPVCAVAVDGVRSPGKMVRTPSPTASSNRTISPSKKDGSTASKASKASGSIFKSLASPAPKRTLSSASLANLARSLSGSPPRGVRKALSTRSASSSVDEDLGSTITFAALVDVVVERRPELGLAPLGKGAYAQVITFTSPTAVILEGGARVVATDLAVKIGAWTSEAHFDRECETQKAAAAEALAPALYGGAWRGGPRGLGVIVMRRLTTPTYYKWLSWLTKDLRRAGLGSADGGWAVDPKVQHLPLVQAWAAEVRRLKQKLALLDIRHGDVHEMNIVFEVPGERARAFAAFAAGDGKRAKRALMAAIAAGPGQSGVEVVMIDFGQARKLGWLGRCCLRLCGDDVRLVDPDDDDAHSDATADSERGDALAHLGTLPTAVQREDLSGLARLRYDVEAAAAAARSVASPRA